jgi:hypothetical protein
VSGGGGVSEVDGVNGTVVQCRPGTRLRGGAPLRDDAPQSLRSARNDPPDASPSPNATLPTTGNRFGNHL